VRNTWIFASLTAVVTVLAGISHYAHATTLLTFVLSTLALAGLAWLVSFSTEQVGERFGPAVTGVMQSTLGNLPEFFVVLFALSAGELVIAQTAIIGSIFANALLVLGVVVIAGCRESSDGIMRFSVALPKDNAILMMLASFLIVIIGISAATNDPASHHIESISIVGAIALLATYLVWIVHYIRGDERGLPSQGEPAVSMTVSLILLGVAGVGAAFVSDWFVDSLAPSMARLGVPQAFAGLVIVAIAGNAVENTTGVVMALKGKSDLAISVVKNSVAQITAFLFPALVLASLFLATRLTFQLAPVFIGALALTGIALWQITSDGEATPFEGVALVALYVILAVLTWYE
jgi:Ca2+:H+ antiporter